MMAGVSLSEHGHDLMSLYNHFNERYNETRLGFLRNCFDLSNETVDS